MGDNRGGPGRGSDCVSEPVENFFVHLVLFENPLGEGFAWSSNGGSLPDVEDLVLITDGDTSGVNEEVELVVAEKGHPLEPLNIALATGLPDWARREAR